MCTDVNYAVDIQHLAEISVKRHKAMMRSTTTSHHHSHWITFEAEGGLHADEYIPEAEALHQNVAAKGIYGARCWPPFRFNIIYIRTQTTILWRCHSMCDIYLRPKTFGVSLQESVS